MIESFLKYDKFKNINLQDPFFDSLKKDYNGFEEWFKRKADNKAYYYEDNEGIQAFLYLKLENEEIDNITYPQPKKWRVKIGTLKINPHGTRLGERFLKKAFDYAVANEVEELYVTVFPKHDYLIKLFERYGFEEVAEKLNGNYEEKEKILLKNIKEYKNDILKDYPLVNARDNPIFLLAIKPEYHTELFPDSILHNESIDIIENVTHSNSIHKVFVSKAPNARNLKRGAVVVIYRTGDGQSLARFRAVATSLCVVEEIKRKEEFNNFEEFVSYCGNYSVFSEKELEEYYNNRNSTAIKLTYNLAMERKLIRDKLINECGLNESERWTLMKLNHSQLNKIIELGGIRENYIIN